MDGYVVNNHGEYISHLNGVVVIPLTNGRTSWLINGGDPNHLLSVMILQVGDYTTQLYGDYFKPL